MATHHAELPGRAASRDRSVEPSPWRMARLIEGEIIPRLLLAHLADRDAATRAQTGQPAFARGEPTAFAHMALRFDVHQLLAQVESHLQNGVAIDCIYLELLAPTARVLGDLWDNDVCDFVDVTMGMWRLQQVIHELGNRAACRSARTRSDRRALFTVPPGDQHSFGLVMIEDFFRRAGWRTWSAPDAALPDLCAIVERQWFELIGLTVSNEEHLAALPKLLRELRQRSQNPAVGIMVGGKIFSDRPELADSAGADATAADGPHALAVAEHLVERLARHRDGASA